MKRIALINIILLLLSVAVFGQEWRSHTNTDNIRQIAIQSDNVWGVSPGGIVSLKPDNGEILKFTNTEGFGGIDFQCVDIDSSGNIWFGTLDGWLSKFTPSGDIVNYPVRETSGSFQRNIAVFDLAVDGDRLWMANDLGVSKFLIYSNGGEIKDTARRLGDLDIEEDATSVAVIGDNLWVGTERGIAFIDKDNQNIQFFDFWRSFAEGENGLVEANINDIESYFDTTIIGTENGIYKFETSPDTVWTVLGLVGLSVRNMTMFDDTLYASTNNGVYYYDGIEWTHLSVDGLPTGGTTDIAFDSLGNIWGGTITGGLAYFEDVEWSLFSIPGPASNLIKKITLDLTGAIWMTHDGKGVSKLDGEEWTIHNRVTDDTLGFSDNNAYSITTSPDNSIWVGNWGSGLFRYDHVDWDHWTDENSPMWGVTNATYYWAATDVEFDWMSNLWVTSLAADSGLIMGVFNPTDSIWNIFLTGPNTINKNSGQVLIADENTIWIGMNEGLHRLNHNGTPFDASDDNWQSDVSLEYVIDMCLDPLGNLWFGGPAGLRYITTATNVERIIELPSDIAGSVSALACDGIGNLWVGTENGLGVLKPLTRPDNIRWKATYQTDTSRLLNNEVLSIGINTSSGLIYIGTKGGLSIFDSGQEAPSDDLSDIKAFPNPVIIPNGHDEVFFKGRPTTGFISIYTVNGDLVDTFDAEQTDSWNLRNAKGENIAGGIYIFVVESEGKSGAGKFAVIK